MAVDEIQVLSLVRRKALIKAGGKEKELYEQAVKNSNIFFTTVAEARYLPDQIEANLSNIKERACFYCPSTALHQAFCPAKFKPERSVGPSTVNVADGET